MSLRDRLHKRDLFAVMGTSLGALHLVLIQRRYLNEKLRVALGRARREGEAA